MCSWPYGLKTSEMGPHPSGRLLCGQGTSCEAKQAWQLLEKAALQLWKKLARAAQQLWKKLARAAQLWAG